MTMPMHSLCAIRPGRADRLFCYGTLCVPEIMRQVSGRLPRATPAILPNHVRYALCGLSYPGMHWHGGVSVQGLLYHGLRKSQWQHLDAYEGHQYRRVPVWVLSAGQRWLAWTYVLQSRYHRRSRQTDWLLAEYPSEQLHLLLG